LGVFNAARFDQLQHCINAHSGLLPQCVSLLTI
jgi:hypothetical protein